MFSYPILIPVHALAESRDYLKRVRYELYFLPIHRPLQLDSILNDYILVVESLTMDHIGSLIEVASSGACY